MTDPFAQLIPDARAFLSDLSANNDRTWFNDHKPDYDARLKAPAKLLLEQVSHNLSCDPGWTAKGKLFRAQRDVRFSKDKTPYHLHLHLLWAIPPAGLFFGIAPGYVRVGGGIMAFEKTALIRWREAVSGPGGDEIATILSPLAAEGFATEAPELKRVPAPYDKDHPHAGLLRRKGLTVWRDLPEPEWAAPQAALLSAFRRLHPLLTQLQTV